MSCWLLTRPLQDSRSLAKSLEARGHASVIAPVIEVAYREDEPPPLDDVQALLFTSQNGVRAFAVASGRRDIPVLAVGRSTADAAGAEGFQEIESADGDSAALARLAIAKLDPSGGALLHVAGKQVAGDLRGQLEKAGFATRRAVLYEARPSIGCRTRRPRHCAGAMWRAP